MSWPIQTHDGGTGAGPIWTPIQYRQPSGSGGGGGTPAAPAQVYGDYALDSLHLANGHLFGEKRVISGDPNNPGQSKYDYQTVDLGDASTPAGLAAISAATTIPINMLTQQMQVLADQNAQTAKGAVSSNFEYVGSFNGQDLYSATNPDGTRTTYSATDLVGKGWANQNDLNVIKQNYVYSQNKMAAGNRLQNVTSMGNGMYAVTNPDGSRTTMNGQQVMATQSATQSDLALLDREKTQKDLDYARDTGLASKVSNISYAGNGQYSATNYYGAHGTYGANQLLTGQPAPPVPGQPPPTVGPGTLPAPAPAPAGGPVVPGTPAPLPTPGTNPPPPPGPAPTVLPGGRGYAMPSPTGVQTPPGAVTPAATPTPSPAPSPAPTPSPTAGAQPAVLPGSPNAAPTSSTSSAALGVSSSANSGQSSSGDSGAGGTDGRMAGGGNYLGTQTSGSDSGAGGSDGALGGSAASPSGSTAGGASSGGAASSTSTGDGSATQAELDQARNQWNQQQAAAYKQKLMGTSRSGVGMGFSGSQATTAFTGVQ